MDSGFGSRRDNLVKKENDSHPGEATDDYEADKSVKEGQISRTDKLGSAGLYVVVSILITFANKVVLTSYDLRSFVFVSFSQALTAVILLPVVCKVFKYPLPSDLWKSFKSLHPLPLISVLNAVFSLGGTQRLSIPMMTVLRRFTILLTMIFELFLLKVYPSPMVAASVAMMIIGAVIAVVDDLVFSLSGYIFVLSSDVFTALNGVFNKKKMEDCKEVGMHGILFVNNLFCAPVMCAVSILNGDMKRVIGLDVWKDPRFIAWFGLASTLGVCLHFSMLYCTHANSALTTSVVGCLKNIATTYGGMVLVPGYAFTVWNFIGINLSMAGSLVYSGVRYFEIRRKG
mmetsp:Transcript_38668/g.152691  ORF Transcript_38668/g.152691 Transcript_38668/m.152691 type:complete len:343 (-) Transcript_38668:6626-7654(-)